MLPFWIGPFSFDRLSALPTSWKRRGQLFWLGVCEFRMILVGFIGPSRVTKIVIDESSLANPYRQRSLHQYLDDIDGSNGFGIHQIEILILMAGKHVGLVRRVP
jgi:hypothetical protein